MEETDEPRPPRRHHRERPGAIAGVLVDLLQYVGGSDVVLDPDNGHVGAVHVAITVADLDAVLGRLRDRRIEAISEPILASAPMAGHRCVYVVDPDRIRVELVEPPRVEPPREEGGAVTLAEAVQDRPPDQHGSLRAAGSA